jgi:hypothetical protein
MFALAVPGGAGYAIAKSRRQVHEQVKRRIGAQRYTGGE